MAFAKKTWKDRISQYPNRRTITDENGVTKPVTVGRDEGTITEVGDGFTASNMNDLEERIEQAFDDVALDIEAGDNINISGNVISVTGFMTASDAHTIWNNA